jgi:hypothetical protein
VGSDELTVTSGIVEAVRSSRLSGIDTSDVFAERLLQVIDEGRRTATYKLALLLALIDASAERCEADGRAPAELTARTIAEHVVALYYPQVRVYLAVDGSPRELRQITLQQSVTMNAVLSLHGAAQDRGASSLAEAMAAVPVDYERCVTRVEENFARYPLRLLQTIGRSDRPFLYDLDGDCVRFRPGAADHLLRLAPLIRPLVELHWTRMVASLNALDLEGEHLRVHLFGSERIAFPVGLRRGLVELQGGRCFYCDAVLGPRTEVDHFLPWSRWPNDAIENLVIADRCNGSKSHYLAGARHVDRWADRFEHRGGALRLIADDARWRSEPARSIGLARSCYAHLAEGTPTWIAVDEFAVDDLLAIRARLERVRA